MDLQAQLCVLQLWQTEVPSVEALSSTLPFCVDTLSFPQWLQFVFIARINNLLGQRAALPTSCQIAPMAAQSSSFSRGCPPQLLACLQAIDVLLSGD